jgi:hypothetical protein
MGFFRRILETLGLDPASETAAPARTVAPTVAGPGAVAGAPKPPQAVAPMNVVTQLDQRAAANPLTLNWRTSIVDLLKLLDIDSSAAARRELATELGCPAEFMQESARMNLWLHETVLARIAADGDHVPRGLLH